MDWDKLRIFHAVAQAGSFTHAGESLGLSQSAVSRQIGALEASLSLPLFHRHARGLELTEQGELLYRAAHEMFAKVAIAEAMLQDSMAKPSGELRVTTTVGFGTVWLTQRLKPFLEMFPDIRVSLLVTDDEVDLTTRVADVAIRMREPIQPDLVRRKLITVHHHLYGSAEYLKSAGTPRTVDDLAGHRLVVYGEGAPTPLINVNWLLNITAEFPDRHIVQINNIYGVLRATEAGLGIASLPDYLTSDSANLVQVLPEYEGPSFDTYFVYPEELRDSKRIAVFRDFLVRQVAEWSF